MKRILNNGTLYVFLAYMLGIIAVSQLLGCDSAKQSAKNWHRSYRQDKAVNGRLCDAMWGRPDSVNEKVVYKEGKPVIVPGATKYVKVNCDSAVKYKTKYVNIPCGQTDTVYRVDTVDRSKYELNTKKGEIAALQKDFNTAMQQIATKNQQNKTLRLWIWVLTLYTAARWILRFATKGRIKLP